ncbi:helix-turn-helix transcriptional regulator [Pseudomonas chlororaphis]|uniref:helix-turn-helix transcriptional regulator n=1 Tax=Pseudomonas chlororaphis TaxID=587753 RepID=UPI002365A56A|nr:LuxR family transcriptional regulator [Pseudomonas chlororaphis]WDH19937.1 LuxR C-terminal-related transcriptional regulator [Pseudomonas chlororaphis]
MHRMFREVSMHSNLGRVIEHIGRLRFWKQLTLLLQQWVPFDHALAIFYPGSGAPVVLELYDAVPHDGPAIPVYLDGLYQLDPFYQACRDGISNGLHRLEEVAPDQFRQSEYFLNYFHANNMLEDEEQFIVQVPGQGVLSLSLGTRQSFTIEQHGILTTICPWVLALMEHHWQEYSQSLHLTSGVETSQMRDALGQFGSSILSEREMEIARLILRGYSTKAIARLLTISPETVKVHRRHLYRKLDISSQPELFALFLQSLGHDLENHC